MRDYDRTDGDYFLWNPDSSINIYKVEDNKIRCINCDIDQEYNNEEDAENDNKQTSIIINENGVSVKGDTISNSKKVFKELKINKDGIIIKTN